MVGMCGIEVSGVDRGRDEASDALNLVHAFVVHCVGLTSLHESGGLEGHAGPCTPAADDMRWGGGTF